MGEIKGKIELFLSKVFRRRDLADDEDIFANGAVNSLFAIQLVLFLEKEFKVRIENNDMDIENFKTVNSIASLVMAKIEQPHKENFDKDNIIISEMNGG